MRKFYPYIYFWLTALSIMVISEIYILNISHDTVINIKETYYVISRKEIGFVFCSMYLLVGCIYWLFQKNDVKLNTDLIAVHTFISIGTVLVYYAFLIYYRYFKIESIFDSSSETYINLILIFTTLLIQVHFVFNIIHSFIKHKTRKKI